MGDKSIQIIGITYYECIIKYSIEMNTWIGSHDANYLNDVICTTVYNVHHLQYFLSQYVPFVFFPPRNYNLSFYCLNNFLHSLLFAGSVWQYRQPYQQRHRFLREVRSFRRPAMQNRAGICEQIEVRHFILSSKNLKFLCWYIALSTDRLRGHQ